MFNHHIQIKKALRKNIMSVFEFYDPFKNPKLQQSQNQKQNFDALAQKIKTNFQNVHPSKSQQKVFSNNFQYPQNFYPYQINNSHWHCNQPPPPNSDNCAPIDIPKNCFPNQNCTDNTHFCNPPKLCPRCGMPKKICHCFPKKHNICFPNYICFPALPFGPCTNSPNLQYGISFSDISMPNYDNFQSQRAFMFWVNKNCP